MTPSAKREALAVLVPQVHGLPVRTRALCNGSRKRSDLACCLDAALLITSLGSSLGAPRASIGTCFASPTWKAGMNNPYQRMPA